MTTEDRTTGQVTRSGGSALLVGAAVAALIVGALLTLVGAFAGGSSAAYGALTGTLVTVGVLAFGTFVVNTVAAISPGASLLVALVTYVLQLVLLVAVMLWISRAGLLEDGLDRRWLALGVVAATLTWAAAQIRAAMRARIPLYDLPDHRPEASAR